MHLSVFLNPSGKGKMSKRHAVDAKGGVSSIFPLDMRDLGYLPEAVVNWLALMGWSYDDHTELFSMADLIEQVLARQAHAQPGGRQLQQARSLQRPVHPRLCPMTNWPGACCRSSSRPG